ncbi:hypothetical protein ALQ57_101089 [Pseudomonas amygdali pv. hibisci]|uniref:Uncharacterized protein n=4 Tax=Pseudomonas syringae group TaxID=136849 RepID=A0A3M6H8D4_PSEAJ|nr:hypothetical protein ALO67_101074 [Pseudomonas amygdali pv. hibisci]RMM47426.1 hypothetical protein ALQ79_101265 [Pseudomonas amygdali pv. lachrymans]RMR60454.1 hypothetical protein ALP83_100872 [Pseudomonas syringae pv. actinidiae]RMW01098.1 hypothetical protein ALP03_101372 [Pseudomonas amygdali pv. tabaci]RMN56862.1 hypothetical protein ALQ57_101089 [Pseudomonas amygdali pv. hibisci]
MKNEHCPALCHDTSSDEPYELKPASDALSVVSARIHFARRMTVTPHMSKRPTRHRNFFHVIKNRSTPANTGQNPEAEALEQRLHQSWHTFVLTLFVS